MLVPPIRPIYQIEEARSFGRCSAGVSRFYCPASLDEVCQVFDIAKLERRRVVVRGGGHSFDGQAVHNGDAAEHIVLSTETLPKPPIRIDTAKKLVTLSAGYSWGEYFQYASSQPGPLFLPGSMQTGRLTTVGGSLSGDCLSRFSGVGGKESQWVESFRLLTTQGQLLDVSRQSNSDLFRAVIGGHGYLGLVTEATYRLVAVPNPGFARTDVTIHDNFTGLIQHQLQLVGNHKGDTRAISSAWFNRIFSKPGAIKGGVFDSYYSAEDAGLPGFPLYSSIDSPGRVAIELFVRAHPFNQVVHEYLLGDVEIEGKFQNELLGFLFFMDGNTHAKLFYEKKFHEWFQIVQQTFVVPTANAVDFATILDAKMRKYHLRPTECDMLYVAADDCWMSGNYNMNGFAISMAFEPIRGSCPSPKIVSFLQELSIDCMNLGGRLHWVKNAQAFPDTFRRMFNDQGQMDRFEQLKRQYDPHGLLQNEFSDRFFHF